MVNRVEQEKRVLDSLEKLAEEVSEMVDPKVYCRHAALYFLRASKDRVEEAFLHHRNFTAPGD